VAGPWYVAATTPKRIVLARNIVDHTVTPVHQANGTTFGGFNIECDTDASGVVVEENLLIGGGDTLALGSGGRGTAESGVRGECATVRSNVIVGTTGYGLDIPRQGTVEGNVILDGTGAALAFVCDTMRAGSVGGPLVVRGNLVLRRSGAPVAYTLDPAYAGHVLLVLSAGGPVATQFAGAYPCFGGGTSAYPGLERLRSFVFENNHVEDEDGTHFLYGLQVDAGNLSGIDSLVVRNNTFGRSYRQAIKWENNTDATRLRFALLEGNVTPDPYRGIATLGASGRAYVTNTNWPARTDLRFRLTRIGVGATRTSELAYVWNAATRTLTISSYILGTNTLATNDTGQVLWELIGVI
jgi:hypothetical protein